MDITLPRYPADRPFLPSDLARPDQALIRAAVARFVTYVRGSPTTVDAIAEFARKSWPRDNATEAVLTRGATTPTTSAANAIAATSVGGFLASLRTSGSGKLINAATRLPLSTVSSISLPGVVTYPAVPFVLEGSPAPVSQAVFNGAVLGPLSLLSVIISATEELAQVAVQPIEELFTALLREAGSRALDGALFSAVAASASRPAGLINGLSTLTPTAGGGAAALASDVEKLIDALVTAGAGDAPLLLMSSGRAVKARIWAPGLDPAMIVASPSIASTRVIAVDSAAFAFGFSNEVDVQVGRETTLHMENAAPQQLGVSGSPTLPIRSMWQTNSIAVKLNLRVFLGAARCGR
jgi:hypothetical protein